ncbi:uncharacterized protein SCHCODRAFT_01189970 [Schizophyllum commune H4-8]|nr:uncharacterized protein SCHCODRAFT_01189970 [Schizophyllum commune H4-8]KAI5892843.1 hypothetical protein SCHCODRAFT_01189970 [Schizophyllum commune H4-8]
MTAPAAAPALSPASPLYTDGAALRASPPACRPPRCLARSPPFPASALHRGFPDSAPPRQSRCKPTRAAAGLCPDTLTLTAIHSASTWYPSIDIHAYKCVALRETHCSPSTATDVEHPIKQALL